MTLVRSEYSTTKYAAPAAQNGWLKDPLDPTRNMEAFVDNPSGSEIAISADRGDAVFDAVGRKLPIVIVDTVKGDTFPFTLQCFAVDELLFEALWESCRTLLFQLPDGRQWYIQVQKRTKRLPAGTGDYIKIDIEAVEVDRP